MGLSLILAGFIFLIVPTVGIVDVMPDAIGYFLIFAGLGKLKYIDRYMSKAAHYAFVMALVNLSKPAVLFLCFADSAAVQSSNITTATLIYLVIELIFGLVMMKNLFDGFIDVGYQFDDSAPCARKLLGRFAIKRKKLSGEHSVKNPQSAERKVFLRAGRPHAVRYVKFERRKAVFRGVDALYAFSMIFFALRCVLTLIPELTTLAYRETAGGAYEQVSDSGVNIALAALCLFAGTVIGVAWYVAASKYIRGLKRDTVFSERLDKVWHEKVADNPDALEAIGYSSYYKLMLAALVFGADFFANGADFIPDAAAGLLLLFAAISIRKRPFGALRIGAASAYTALASVCLYLQISSAALYYRDTGLGVPPAVKLFGVLFPVSKAAFTLIVILFFISEIKFIDRRFGYAPIYSKGRLAVGAAVIAFSQIVSAVGYYTDVASEDLIHFPVAIGQAIIDMTVYVSLTAMIIYYVGVISFAGGISAVMRKISGKD